MVFSKTLLDTIEVSDSKVVSVIPFLFVLFDVEEFKINTGFEALNINIGFLEETA